VVTGAAEPGLAMLGAFRDATGLVQESAGKVRDAWQALIGGLHDLAHRRRDDAVTRAFAAEIEQSLAAADALVSRMRPDFEAVVDALTATVGRAGPVFALFDAAISMGDAAEHLSGLSAEMTGRAGPETWRGAAREGYDRRVREQAGAADAAAADVVSASGWLMAIGAANTAYVTNVGHLGAELVGRLAEAAVEAVEATPGEAPRLVATLERLAEFLTSSRSRVAGWRRDLQNQFAATLARAEEPRPAGWPAATVE